MIIKTATGSRYEIDERRICRKFDNKNRQVDTFKVIALKCVHKNVQNLEDLAKARKYNKIQVGRRLYVAGTNVWWLSTEIVEVT